MTVGWVSRRPDLRRDPRIGARDSLPKRHLGLPPDRCDARLAEITGVYSYGARDILDGYALAGHLDHGPRQIGYRHPLVAPEIHGAVQVGAHQRHDPVHQIIHVGKHTDRRAVTPDLDGPAVPRLRDLPAKGRRRFFTAARPGPFRTVAVLEAGDPHPHRK